MPDADPTSDIRNPKNQESRPGLAEDVKESLIASGIGRQTVSGGSDKSPKVRIASRISIFEHKLGHVRAAGR